MAISFSTDLLVTQFRRMHEVALHRSFYARGERQHAELGTEIVPSALTDATSMARNAGLNRHPIPCKRVRYIAEDAHYVTTALLRLERTMHLLCH